VSTSDMATSGTLLFVLSGCCSTAAVGVPCCCWLLLQNQVSWIVNNRVLRR
jgi:hypothetical protein